MMKTRKLTRPKPRLFVRMFKPQFAGKVERWEKLQTVRLKPKRMPRPGDRISHRTWTGAPYRSKQRILGEATISKVSEIIITDMIWIDGLMLMPREMEAFAEADGFKNLLEFLEFFETEHGPQFRGIVIYWEKPT